MNNHILLANTHKSAPKGAKPLPHDAVVTVSLLIRSKDPVGKERAYKAIKAGTRKPLTIEQFEQKFGASQEDIAKVAEVLTQHGLTMSEVHVGSRRVSLTGTPAQMKSAFRTNMISVKHSDGNTYQAREGSLYLPTELEDIVHAVRGLDERPVAKRKSLGARTLKAAAAGGAKPMTPIQLAQLPKMPMGTQGKGQAGAMIELGGGFDLAKLKAYWTKLGIKTPPSITAFSADGASNTPDGPQGADGEVQSDICVMAAIAPAAKFGVYFGQNSSDGFMNVTSMALHDKTLRPRVVSISWGMYKDASSQQDINGWIEIGKDSVMLGVFILVATGDDGSTDNDNDGKSHVDWPGSCSDIIGVGGLRVIGDSTTVWGGIDNDGAGGGGVDDTQAVPAYQLALAKATGVKLPVNADSGKAGRVLPDVSENADPQTGYIVMIDGQLMVIGGTSLSTPFVAVGLMLMYAEGATISNFHNVIYSLNFSVTTDVTEGTNGAYNASAGFDACSGLGYINWDKFLTALKAGTSSKKRRGGRKAA